MAQPDVGPRAAARTIEQELAAHAALKTRIDGLARDAGALGPDPEPAMRAVMVSRLRDLIAKLRAHFAAEVEPGGLYDDLERALPHRRHELARMAGEHAKLLDELSSLARLLEREEPLPGDFALRADDALARLSRHEAHENQCMFDAVGDREAGGQG